MRFLLPGAAIGINKKTSTAETAGIGTVSYSSEDDYRKVELLRILSAGGIHVLHHRLNSLVTESESLFLDQDFGFKPVRNLRFTKQRAVTDENNRDSGICNTKLAAHFEESVTGYQHCYRSQAA